MKPASHLYYTCLLSGGGKSTGQYKHASDAIQDALERLPGQTVIECFSGHKEPIKHLSGQMMAPAYINYEIPPHKPYVFVPKPKKEKKKKEDGFGFVDKAFLAESKKAKGNYEHASVFTKP